MCMVYIKIPKKRNCFEQCLCQDLCDVFRSTAFSGIYPYDFEKGKIEKRPNLAISLCALTNLL